MPILLSHPAAVALLGAALGFAGFARAQTAPPHAFEGLLAGESALPAAPLAGEADGFACLRFLDAQSSRPLPGVRVEAWTEPGCAPLHVPVCIDDTRSAEDGSVRVHWRLGAIRGEKLRVSRPGYESQQIAPDDGEVLLMQAAPLRGRVLDLAARPVAGATIRSRQSCAHAVSASQTQSAADGSFVLDDFPIGGGPELEVLADGFSARGELEPLLLRQQDLDARARGEFGCTLLLASCTPWRLRLLDADGKPLAHRRVWTTDRPVLAQWTDGDGVCTFTPPTGASELTLETCDALPKLRYLVPMTPREGITALRPLDPRPAAERAGRAAGVVRFDLSAWRQPAPDGVARVTVFTDDGFVVEPDPSGAWSVPVGSARAVVTGALGEWLGDLALVAGPQALSMAPVPAPRIVVRATRSALDEHAALLASCGSSSVLVEPCADAEEVLFPLSPDAQPAVALEGADGSLRLAQLAPDPDHDGDLRAEFPAAARTLVPPRASAPVVRVPWRGADGQGSLAAQRGTVWPAGPGYVDLEGERALELPEGCLYYAEFSADGAVPRAVLRRARADESERIDLVRRARLEISGDASRVWSSTGAVERDGARFVLEPAPGALFVHVEHGDGTLSLLSLVLQPGEARALVAR